MPTETFLKLPQEKKEKILASAKQEFTRANLQEASIKNITEGAKIARGSFYQYFESKEDLLRYILTEDEENIHQTLVHILKKADGDIFEAAIIIYDKIIHKSFNEKNMAFYQKVFENIKTGKDTIFTMEIHHQKERNRKSALKLIKVDHLKVQTEEDLMMMINMVVTITKKAIVSSFRYESKEKAREDYLKQLELLKYGMKKQKEEKDV